MVETANYGSLVQRILDAAEHGLRLMPLAPQNPLKNPGLDSLEKASTEDLFDSGIASLDFAKCVHSALFLYFSALEESHRISQDIPTPTGALLHAIMHRQEPDYSNSKYWFNRVGKHELYPTLREEALRLRLENDSLRAEIERRRDWDAIWFVDEVEKAVRGRAPEHEDDLRSIQRLEWQLIFDYSYRRALAG